jgi:hypothetical protein
MEGNADVSSEDDPLEPVPLFENSISFKSEVFDSSTKFEKMKKKIPKVTVDLL